MRAMLVSWKAMGVVAALLVATGHLPAEGDGLPTAL
jgi:hypothetical protein